MGLIEIGDIDKNIFYPIFGGIFILLNGLLFYIDNLTKLPNHSLILSVASSLGMSLSFILLILYRNKDNKNQNQNSNQKLKYELEYSNQYQNITYDKYKYILLTSVLDFTQTLLLYEFCNNIGINFWIFDILFIYLFSFLIFKIKIYSHQYISIIIIIIVGIALDIFDDRYKKVSGKILPIIIKFICEIIISLGLVINKYTMEKKFCTSYYLCFYQGIITFILYFILLLFATYFNFFDNFRKYYNDIKNDKLKESLIFFLEIIIQFIINICIFATIEKTTTFHIIIILIIGQLAPYKRLKGSKTKIKKNIIIIAGLCFILFMTLIFNEIIILNCYGLEKNTRKFISERAEVDKAYKNIDNDKINEDNNEDEDLNKNQDLRIEENMEDENISNK